MPVMNSSEQHFFRFIMLNKICTKEVASQVFFKLNESEGSDNQDMSSFFEKLNGNIRMYDLELVEGKSELTGDSMVALVKTYSNQLSEGKTGDKKSSLLFSKLLSKILLAKDKCLSETSAVNLSSGVELSKSAVQALLQNFIQEMWFEEQDGRVYLGPRSILELGTLLSKSYPDHIEECPLCRNSVFYGKACHSCHKRLHIYCLERFLENTNTCPSCKEEWSEEILGDNSKAGEGPSRSKRPRLISE